MLRKHAWTFSFVGVLWVLVVAAVGFRPSHRGAAPDGVENLRAFAKLYGYVRYFHPSDAASAIDWDRFAIHGVREVYDAASPEELRAALQALFKPIAPTVRIYAASEQPPPPAAVLMPDDTATLALVAWQHKGVDLGARSPYRSVRLNRETVVDRGAAFGPFAQRVDAVPHRGKQMRLRAAVKAEVSGAGNQAQLWLRVDRPDRQMGFFDNMGDRPVTTPEWATYEIMGAVAEDAEDIVFGGFLAGRGTAWFDDVQLFVRESDRASWTPLPVDNAGFEASATGEPPTGWGASGPGYKYATVADAYEGERSLVVESSATVRRAEPLFEERPAAGEVVERPLGRGLVAQVPLALYSEDGQTLRPAEAPPLARLEAELQAIALEALTAADEALRYADVVVAWNVFQHFYPYFDVVEIDWDAVLTETLRRAHEDETAGDFLRTLQWMVAQLDDGHGRVNHPVLQPESGLPLLFDYVEGEVVIVALTDAASGEACYRRGDIVTAIDGVPSKRVLTELKQYISGSPQWKMYRALHQLGHGSRGTTACLTLERMDQFVTCEVVRDFDGVLQEERPGPIERLREDVYYVDLSRAEMRTIEQEAPALTEAAGVVFDVRGYPNGTHGVLQYLTDKPLRSAHWQVPQRIYPDQMKVAGYDTTGRWTLPPEEPRFTGQIVFLTDARAVSYAESVMGIVEHYQLGEIVGQPTAGANGNVNPFTLPGGYRLSWTGMRVVKHDGSQHHLVGIKPTVSVERTLEGVRAGRDEYLEKALEMID